MNASQYPHLICQNPECPHAFHALDPLSGILASVMGNIVINLSAPADDLTPDQLKGEVLAQAELARQEGADEYATKLVEFAKSIETENTAEDAVGETNLAECESVDLYNSAEAQQLQRESYQADIEYRKAMTAETLAKARLLNAQAAEIEHKLPVEYQLNPV